MLTYGGSFRAPEGFCILARAFCRDRCPRARDHLPRGARVKLGDPCNTARLMRTEGDDTLTARLFLPSPFRCIFGSLGAFFWGRGLTLAKMRTAAGFPEHVERHEHASPILRMISFMGSLPLLQRLSLQGASSFSTSPGVSTASRAVLRAASMLVSKGSIMASIAAVMRAGASSGPAVPINAAILVLPNVAVSLPLSPLSSL